MSKNNSKGNKTKSLASPVDGGRSCLCDDDTYHPDCCNGDLHNQGIGALKGQSISNVTNISNPRTI